MEDYFELFPGGMCQENSVPIIESALLPSTANLGKKRRIGNWNPLKELDRRILSLKEYDQC
jgi:hypothetical protein